MEDYTTRLRMLPVCSCGYVFTKGVIVHEDINETNGFKYAEHYVEPPNCPKCNKKIECIVYDGYTYEHRRY
jgi:hypothetical protein